ncbi:membrane fusion protein, multidrug efflux system [Modicisalibacter muralis]|uniref:Membrane fusion protein, multidrug efflux system n=1 Tax=Modicisalibacter muralis TaxID=119000 RepID=A0A1G9I8I6_9GAMM|nr:efflux RND transporter periplasmic adaptor subunit [Halomonas muralis]SDL21580.1 membrane fusion protein, multidrug efflux system [Halomonas muralis]
MRNNKGVRRLGWSMALVSLVLAGCGQESTQQQAGQQQQPPPLAAQVLKVQPRNLPVDKQYSALLRSEQQVVVTARVTGILEEKHYQEGERVKKGQLLFTIEPARYEATVRQRRADLQSAEAELYRAQRNWERFERLYEQNSVSQQQRDEALATLKIAQAMVAQAEAALDDAQIDLDYTTVTAPVSGQIGLSEVNVGSLVQPPQELVTITSLRTIEARFALPPEDAAALRQLRRTPGGGDVTPVALANLTPDSEMDRLRGRLNYLGASVDRDTGTVQVEATFDNPQSLFLPGQFVHVKLDGLVMPNAIAVPEIAVLEGREGPMVYVVAENGEAKPVNVNLGDRAGPWIVIDSGLEPGQQVVVTHVASVQPGRRIEPQPFDGKAEPKAVSAGNQMQEQPASDAPAATPEASSASDKPQKPQAASAQEGDGE